MHAVKVNSKNAEPVRLYLKKHAMLDIKHKVIRSNSFIYFPVLSADAAAEAVHVFKSIGVEKSKIKPVVSRANSNYRDILRKKLGEEYADAVKGFDILGNIAIIDAEPALARRIAEAVMETNRSVSTVLRKSGAVHGTYRTRRYTYVAGKRTYMADYTENGARLIFDVRKTFFSCRLSFERSRISRLSRGRENVIVMFAGVGPFAIEIAKHNSSAKVVAIELNGYAYKAMLGNIRLNKTTNVAAVKGDAGKVAEKYKNFADRIVMPLPKDSSAFLGAALACAKKRCTVHYYAFVDIDKGAERCIEGLDSFFKSKGCRFRVTKTRIVRPYAPKTVEIVVDFIIEKTASSKSRRG